MDQRQSENGYTYKCGRCKLPLPRSSFHADPSTKGHFSICKDCRAKNPASVMSNLILNAKKRAKSKGLQFELTREFLRELNERQGGLCPYTGLPLNWTPNKVRGPQRVCPPDRVTIDRIDPKGGYTKDNVQLVTEFVNRIKGWYPSGDVIEFCRLVVENNESG